MRSCGPHFECSVRVGDGYRSSKCARSQRHENSCSLPVVCRVLEEALAGKLGYVALSQCISRHHRRNNSLLHQEEQRLRSASGKMSLHADRPFEIPPVIVNAQDGADAMHALLELQLFFRRLLVFDGYSDIIWGTTESS